MRHQNSVFHQLTKHIPWAAFEAAVAKHGADRGVRRLRTRDQFTALLFGQLSGAPSLRAIEDGLASHRALLYHLGARPVSRSTLADANASRPFEVYRDVFAAMVAATRPGLRKKLGGAVRLIDATRIPLSGLSRGWAPAVKEHHAAKLHVVYDPKAALPLEGVVTAQTVNDITPARALPIEPGATYVFDLGYYSFEWWKELDDKGCVFVTRLKSNTRLRETRPWRKLEGEGLLKERVGRLSKHIMKGKNPFESAVREIFLRREDGRVLRLVTNNLTKDAAEIAALYKTRWEIELFFKWIKQNLKIRRFLGTSENAVKIQIYVALIAFLALRAAHTAQEAAQGRQAFARLVGLTLMQRRDIRWLIDPPPTPPENPAQTTLDLAPC